MVIVRKLEYLVALAKERHFARAAAACHVSQPTLSAAMQQLEIELGVQIVKRGRRFEGFTDAGELVLAWAHRMTNESARLREKLAEQRGSFAGTLRIGVLPSTIPLMRIFTVPFQQRYPNMNLRVTMHDAFEIQHAIEECSLDVGITYLDKNSRHYSRSHVLYTEEYELLIRRGTRFSGKSSLPWDAVKELPLCLLIPDTRIFGAEESEILNEALTKTPHIVSSAIWLVMDHVRSGQWASVLPRPVRIMIAGDKELEAIPLLKSGVSKSGPQPSVGIVLPHLEPRSPQAEAFFDTATSAESLKSLLKLLHSPAAAPAREHRLRKVK